MAIGGKIKQAAIRVLEMVRCSCGMDSKPPNGHGIELPVARECTKERPTAARRVDHPTRAAGDWRAGHTPGWRPVSSNALLGGALGMTAVRDRQELKATPLVLANYVHKPSGGDREPKGLATAAKPGSGMD
jgi:hypothetical protein